MIGQSWSLRPALLLASLLLAAGCTRVAPPPPQAPPPDLPPPGVDLPPDREEPWEGDPGPGLEVPGGLDAREARSPLPPALPPETGDVRALWVVRTALLHPDSARAAVRRAHEAGFNTLLVQVRGRGDAYYRSRREPPPDAMEPSLREGYDPLATVLEEARRWGLRVHAWINAHLVASALLPPRDPSHRLWAAPGELAVPRELVPRLFPLDPRDPAYVETLLDWTAQRTDRVEGIYVSPSHPGVREHLARVVADLADGYPIDGIHLDYLRYPSPDFDYSRSALAGFRSWIRESGVDPVLLARAERAWPGDPLAYVEAFPALWDEFRRRHVTATMERLYWTVKDRRPEVLVSAAVFADADDARGSRYQDWEGWVREGIAEVVAPMAYTPDHSRFRRQIVRAAEAGGRERVWAGLGIYQTSFQAALTNAREARALGLGGTVLFSYDWAVGPEGTRAAGGAYLIRFGRELQW